MAIKFATQAQLDGIDDSQHKAYLDYLVANGAPQQAIDLAKERKALPEVKALPDFLASKPAKQASKPADSKEDKLAAHRAKMAAALAKKLPSKAKLMEFIDNNREAIAAFFMEQLAEIPAARESASGNVMIYAMGKTNDSPLLPGFPQCQWALSLTVNNSAALPDA